MKNCVYFIGDGLYVKIGFTANIELRLRQLQTGHRSKLLVLAVVPNGTRSTERLLHEAAVGQRAAGEWFKREGAAMRLTAAAQAGKPLLTESDIKYAATLRPESVKIPKHDPAPVPKGFEGTTLADRIAELNSMRKDKNLTPKERGKVYQELRHLVNGRVFSPTNAQHA